MKKSLFLGLASLVVVLAISLILTPKTYADDFLICTLDSDCDRVLDRDDNCPYAKNRDQLDTDHDLIGDACDNDIDNDGIRNNVDNCGINFNEDQTDTDLDGIGDVCDLDVNGDGIPDVDDPDAPIPGPLAVALAELELD